MIQDEAARRRRENKDLLRRMQQGDNLCHTALGAYRWAPRAMIKKDEKAISALYGGISSGAPSKSGLTVVEGGV